MYWSSNPNKGSIYRIKTYISLILFKQTKRSCNISDLERDKLAGFELPFNEKWWYKVEPLPSSLQASFQQYYSPSLEVSIDELMVRCFGR